MATHRFEPTTYHLTLGQHEPVLRIQSGDTVETSTLCAGGRDRNGSAVHEGGNPQTGPFYIEGAEPGDVLAVRFDRVVPNRPFGWTVTRVAPNVVEPYFVHELAREWQRGDWEIDLEARTATLRRPETTAGAFSVPIEPMLGCFGVAPPGGQALTTATSSVNGGNMDYRGFGEGTTVYFPVFAPGALFHLGDGHAVQGDGEIVGTGIEISMDVTFTAWVHRKQRPIMWPRAEKNGWMLVAGNARPLDQALQHATTELIRWMLEDTTLDLEGVAVILGQCIRYEIGNVFDPAYTVIAKIESRLLDPYRTAPAT